MKGIKKHILGIVAISISVAGQSLSEQTDRFMGDWQGTWTRQGGGSERPFLAQVIPRAENVYLINFLAEFDMRGEPYLFAEGKRQGKRVQFNVGDWSGSIDDEVFMGTATLRDQMGTFKLKKVTRLSPNLGLKAPADAIVLYDGTGFNEWEGINNGSARAIPWKNENSVMTIVPSSTRDERVDILTKRQFRDFHLHLEFMIPLLAEKTGQARSNSGVIIRDYHFIEVQILDSYGLPGYWNECGGVYRTAAPKVNMCAPPLQWQSYDIYYQAPRFDWNGNLLENPRLTIDHNGKLIHKDLKIPYSERAVKTMREHPDRVKPGQIMLQDHTNVIHFRNIWIKENEALTEK